MNWWWRNWTDWGGTSVQLSIASTTSKRRAYTSGPLTDWFPPKGWGSSPQSSSVSSQASLNASVRCVENGLWRAFSTAGRLVENLADAQRPTPPKRNWFFAFGKKDALTALSGNKPGWVFQQYEGFLWKQTQNNPPKSGTYTLSLDKKVKINVSIRVLKRDISCCLNL